MIQEISFPLLVIAVISTPSILRSSPAVGIFIIKESYKVYGNGRRARRSQCILRFRFSYEGVRL